MGRDAFLDALDNPQLRIRILDKEPKTMDKTLRFACRYESFDKCVASANSEMTEEEASDNSVPKNCGEIRQVAPPATTASSEIGSGIDQNANIGQVAL